MDISNKFFKYTDSMLDYKMPNISQDYTESGNPKWYKELYKKTEKYFKNMPEPSSMLISRFIQFNKDRNDYSLQHALIDMQVLGLYSFTEGDCLSVYFKHNIPNGLTFKEELIKLCELYIQIRYKEEQRIEAHVSVYKYTLNLLKRTLNINYFWV